MARIIGGSGLGASITPKPLPFSRQDRTSAASPSRSIATDHRPGQSDNAHRHCMAPGRAVAVEVLAHKSRRNLTGQRRLAAPGTLTDILHRMQVLCRPAPVAHNRVHKRAVNEGVLVGGRPARHRPGNRFRSRHERGPTRYRRLPAPRRRIAARLPKLAITTKHQAQG